MREPMHVVTESYGHYTWRHRNDLSNGFILAGIFSLLLSFIMFSMSSTYKSNWGLPIILVIVAIGLIFLGIKQRK